MLSRLSIILAVGCAWAVVGDPSAGAATACRWVVDPTGDATGSATPGGAALPEPQLDLVEAGIASAAKSLQVSVRVADLGDGEDASPTHDRLYSAVLTLDGSRVVLAAVERDGVFSAQVESAADGAVGAGSPPPQPATVSVNRRADSIVIAAPLSSLSQFVNVRPRSVVQSATLVTSREVTPRYPLFGAPIVSARPDVDDAVTDRTTYTLGDRQCRRS